MTIRKITLGIVIATILVTASAATHFVQQEAAEATTRKQASEILDSSKRIPVATSGENVYVTWWSNKTGNDEVMFRASTDGGATFGDKINLSNTTDAESTRVEIDSDAESVVVTWWETNQTSDTPVMRVSTDNGATFGPLLMLATNGTIGEAEEEPEEGG